MANIEVKSFLQLGVTVPHVSTTYEIYKGSPENLESAILIDKIEKTKIYKDKWWSKLPKPDGLGFYSDEEDLFCRIKLHFEDEINTESTWYYIGPLSQVQFSKDREELTEYKITEYEN
jgi:hypothetical protein